MSEIDRAEGAVIRGIAFAFLATVLFCATVVMTVVAMGMAR